MRFKDHYENQMILEYTSKELTDMSDAPRRRRSAFVKKAEYKSAAQTEDNHLKTIWSVPSVSKQKSYEQVVEIIPKESNAFSIAAGNSWNLKEFSSILKASDIRVYCSCPDFLWGGQKYNLGDLGDYKGALAKGNIGDFFGGDRADVIIPPDVRDPDRQHVLCKHLLKVSKVFAANTSSIMADAKKFNFVKRR